jgi:hypothetical protein
MKKAIFIIVLGVILVSMPWAALVIYILAANSKYFAEKLSEKIVDIVWKDEPRSSFRRQQPYSPYQSYARPYRNMTRKERAALIRTRLNHGYTLDEIAREFRFSLSELINFIEEEEGLSSVEGWLKQNMAEEVQEALRHADESGKT